MTDIDRPDLTIGCMVRAGPAMIAVILFGLAACGQS